MGDVLMERLNRIGTLERGAHDNINNGACLLEAVAYVAGEPWSDSPACVSPVLAEFGRRVNDGLDDERRQQLKVFIPRMVGTANDGRDELRGWLCTDWLSRVHTPAWLELAGLGDAAAGLRALSPLRDTATLSAAMPALSVARRQAAAARSAARSAAWSAAWDAAGDAAWAAAWDATWAAAQDAARADARAAAQDAAWAAAPATLGPTVVASLQASAFELFDQLIDPSDLDG